MIPVVLSMSRMTRRGRRDAALPARREWRPSAIEGTARSLRSIALQIGVCLLLASDVSADPGQIVGAPLVNLRSGPGPHNAPITQLSEGARLEILGVEGNWVNVTTADDQSGYVYRSFVERLEPEPEPASEPAERIDAAPAPTEQLFEEVAYLRSELANLRLEVQNREAPTPEASPAEAGLEKGVARFLEWAFWFSAGAIAGALVMARRGRSQRRRLRF